MGVCCVLCVTSFKASSSTSTSHKLAGKEVSCDTFLKSSSILCFSLKLWGVGFFCLFLLLFDRRQDVAADSLFPSYSVCGRHRWDPLFFGQVGWEQPLSTVTPGLGWMFIRLCAWSNRLKEDRLQLRGVGQIIVLLSVPVGLYHFTSVCLLTLLLVFLREPHFCSHQSL